MWRLTLQYTHVEPLKPPNSSVIYNDCKLIIHAYYNFQKHTNLSLVYKLNKPNKCNIPPCTTLHHNMTTNLSPGAANLSPGAANFSPHTTCITLIKAPHTSVHTHTIPWKPFHHIYTAIHHMTGHTNMHAGDCVHFMGMVLEWEVIWLDLRVVFLAFLLT